MSLKMLSKIDEMIDESTRFLISDTIKLVNIKSVEGEPLDGAPFGEGPKKVLDAFVEMSEKAGFYTKTPRFCRSKYGETFQLESEEAQRPER